MIIDLEKYLIFGSIDDLENFLSQAQAVGVIEF
jgi:hypothetical protein